MRYEKHMKKIFLFKKMPEDSNQILAIFRTIDKKCEISRF